MSLVANSVLLPVEQLRSPPNDAAAAPSVADDGDADTTINVTRQRMYNLRAVIIAYLHADADVLEGGGEVEVMK